MMAGLRRALFREPRAGNMAGWLWFVMAGVGVVVGRLMVVDGLFFSDYSSAGGSSCNPLLVALGAMFALQFAAKLLPKGWKGVAGLLRIGAISVAVTSLLILIF